MCVRTSNLRLLRGYESLLKSNSSVSTKYHSLKPPSQGHFFVTVHPLLHSLALPRSLILSHRSSRCTRSSHRKFALIPPAALSLAPPLFRRLSVHLLPLMTSWTTMGRPIARRETSKESGHQLRGERGRLEVGRLRYEGSALSTSDPAASASKHDPGHQPVHAMVHVGASTGVYRL